jgi:hypothetical protein
MKTFEEDYWKQIYGNLSLMDCVSNAREYARYIHSLMELIKLRVTRLADFGFGLGYLVCETVKLLKPIDIYLLEPSQYAFHKLKDADWIHNYKIIKDNIRLEKFKVPPLTFQLGLCNSIFQYIDDKHIEKVTKKLAKSVLYLYFSVPTIEEYNQMYKENKFQDPWAIQRKSKFYKELLNEYFTFVSWRFLESKFHVTEEVSMFDDELFRGK